MLFVGLLDLVLGGFETKLAGAIGRERPSQDFGNGPFGDSLEGGDGYGGHSLIPN